ncbi:DUF952 domain-containing protein [Brevundimonas sp.]|uniref:DUF952 domain-containing protein n=1 Tax=Brevundimonas sp. TaxID=1871086 RepID=UPI003F7139D0
MSDFAYKLVDLAEWKAALAKASYAGSALDLKDGYIHLSSGAQLAETARRHYAGRSDLVLVAVDLRRTGDALKWEPSRGGDLFPHFYGPLTTDLASDERRLSVDAQGVMRFEDGTVGWP